MTDEPTQVPSEDEFLTVFGVEATESTPEDGYWCYWFPANADDGLQLSFNTHERSVQTAWKSNGKVVCVVVHENMDRLWIEESGQNVRICGRFVGLGDCGATVEIQVLPELEVRWATLIT